MKRLGEIAIRELSTPHRNRENGAASFMPEFKSSFQAVDEPTRQLFSQAAAMVEAMHAGSRPYSLTLLGRSGCGKTHLAREIKEHAHRHLRTYRGHYGETKVRDICFFDWSAEVDRMRAGDWDRINFLCNSWFAVVDDIGAEHRTDWATGKLLQLINRRLGKWTVYTANMQLSSIEEMDERIASRLFRDGGKVVVTTAPDWNRR